MKKGISFNMYSAIAIIASGIVHNTHPMLSRAPRSISRGVSNTYKTASQRARAFVNYFRTPAVLRSYSQPSYAKTTASGQQQLNDRDINKILRTNVPLIQSQPPLQPSMMSRFMSFFGKQTEGEKRGELRRAFDLNTTQLLKKAGKDFDDVENSINSKAIARKLSEELQMKVGYWSQEIVQVEKAIRDFAQGFDTLVNNLLIGEGSEVNPTAVHLFEDTLFIAAQLGFIHAAMDRVVPMANTMFEPQGALFVSFYPILEKLKLLNGTIHTNPYFKNMVWRGKNIETNVYQDLKMGGVKEIGGERQRVKVCAGKKRLDSYIFLDGLRDLGLTHGDTLPENKEIYDYIDQLKQYAQSRGESDLSFMIDDAFTLDQLPPDLQPELGEAWMTSPSVASPSARQQPTVPLGPKISKRSFHTSAQPQQQKKEGGLFSRWFGSSSSSIAESTQKASQAFFGSAKTSQEFFSAVDSYLNRKMSPQDFIKEIPQFKSVINERRPVTVLGKDELFYSIEQSALETLFDKFAFVDIFRGFDPSDNSATIVPNALMSTIAKMEDGRGPAIAAFEWNRNVIGALENAGASLDLNAIKTILQTVHYFEVYFKRARHYRIKLPDYAHFDYQKFRHFYVDTIRFLLVPFIERLGVSLGQLDMELDKKADQDINEFFMIKYIEVKKEELKRHRSPVTDKDVVSPEQIDLEQELLDIDNARVQNKECGEAFDAKYASLREETLLKYLPKTK
jgi:hypothetical protein